MNRILSFASRTLSVALVVLVALFTFGLALEVQAATACTTTLNGSLAGGTLSLTPGTSSGCYVRRFKGTAPVGVTNDSGCVGYHSNGSGGTSTETGTINLSPGAGQCEQADVCTAPWNGDTCTGTNAGGVAKFGGTTGAGLACGEKCTSSSQCNNPSGNGSPVACINGTCQNTMCAEGMTIPGANCSCGSNVRKCGQTCNGTVGLCGPGQGTCTYVNPPPHWYTNQPNCAWGSATYCMGTQNGYSQRQCPATDTGDGGGTMAVAPNGAVNGLSVTDLAKSCQVCGNGDVEVGEVCDLGPNNGKPGYSCDSNCRTVACNSACTSQKECGGIAHVVNFRLRTSGQDIVIDYIKDGNAIIDDKALTQTAGAWTRNTDSAPNGGTYLYGNTPGINVSYTTYSSSITLRTFAATTRGIIDVYVDGVLKTSISNLTTSPAGWLDVPVTVSAPYTYTCTSTGATSACRLTTNPSSSTCSGTTSTPVPPSPSPSAFVCDLTANYTSNANAAAWKFGDMITFSVNAVPSGRVPSTSTVRYEGQVRAYKGTTQVKAVTLTPINATSSQFAPMKVEAANATYYFRFRYCVKPQTGTEVCTNWGAWESPSGN